MDAMSSMTSSDMAMSTGMAMSAAMSPTSSSMSSMSTMGSMMSMDSTSVLMQAGLCEVAMLWNWNTIDSCFLAESWRIQSSGAFAGSCIGVVLLVITLEVLRRLGKETDRWVLNAHRKKVLSRSRKSVVQSEKNESGSDAKETLVSRIAPTRSSSSHASEVSGQEARGLITNQMGFRPTPLQQALRATVHMASFAVAYLLMLILMSFNGYIFISAIIGAWLGFFLLHWDAFTISIAHESETPAPLVESTLCCG